MAGITDFRKAIAAMMVEATGISIVVHGERADGSEDNDMIAVWTTGSAANEENTQFRTYAVTARVLMAYEAQVNPDDDDPLDQLEALDLAVLDAVSSLMGGARVASVDSAYFPRERAIEFTFLGEVLNPAPEV